MSESTYCKQLMQTDKKHFSNQSYSSLNHGQRQRQTSKSNCISNLFCAKNFLYDRDGECCSFSRSSSRASENVFALQSQWYCLLLYWQWTVPAKPSHCLHTTVKTFRTTTSKLFTRFTRCYHQTTNAHGGQTGLKVLLKTYFSPQFPASSDQVYLKNYLVM